MMQLKFLRPHLSISAFPDVDLPKLTVVVGLNGSGKSHLLQSIANGSVESSVFPLPPYGQGDPASFPIKLLTQADPGVEFSSGYMSAGGSQIQSMEPAVQFLQFRDAALEPFRDRLSSLCGDVNGLSSSAMWMHSPEHFVEKLGISEKIEEVRAVFNEAEAELQRLRAPSTGRVPNHEYAAFTLAQQVSARSNISLLQLRFEHLKIFESWGQVDQFSANLAMVFGRYRDAQLRNWMLQKADEDGFVNSALSKDEFIEKFGPAPWTVINATLLSFSLPYEIIPPILNDYTPVSFGFRKIPTGETVNYQNLSSGEKVLASLAISSFQFDDQFLTIRRPKLLLLDEMDAPLHPEMLYRWLSAIKSGLVDGQDIHCILTSHSPTTVALAEEDSLYKMINGHMGLEKISKRDALNTLTFGVPTLSINFACQRPVFAESDTDVSIYQRLYSLLKSHLNCARDLNFLGTGVRVKKDNEVNTGCQVVNKIVSQLVEVGNREVFGLVDWDGCAVSGGRIFVVGEGIYDGIENVLLDPLLISILLMKYRKLPDGVEDISQFKSVDTLQVSDLQRLADVVQSAVLGESNESLIEITYFGGVKLNVRKSYLHMDDHKLEDLLREKLPALNFVRKSRGALVHAVVDHVISEHQCFCPSEIVNIFQRVANASA